MLMAFFTRLNIVGSSTCLSKEHGGRGGTTEVYAVPNMDLSEEITQETSHNQASEAAKKLLKTSKFGAKMSKSKLFWMRYQCLQFQAVAK